MITLYKCPMWETGVSVAEWVLASGVTSAPGYHVLSSDPTAVTIGSGITSTSRFRLKADSGFNADAVFYRWVESFATTYPTLARFFVEISDAPGENEVTYGQPYGDISYVTSGLIASDGYNKDGCGLATFDEIGETYDVFKIGFIGSGTFFLSGLFPMKSLDLLGPVYATSQDYFNVGVTSERTLSGKLRTTSKGLLIRSKFTIVYELLDGDEVALLQDLFETTRGGMYPFGLLFHSEPYMVRFTDPLVFTEEEAGLYNITLDLEEV